MQIFGTTIERASLELYFIIFVVCSRFFIYRKRKIIIFNLTVQQKKKSGQMNTLLQKFILFDEQTNILRQKIKKKYASKVTENQSN